MQPTITPIALEKIKSSQIDSIGHDAATNTLAIRFKSYSTGKPTSLYHYANFTAEDFEALRNAESIGKHFGKHIKPFDVKYPFQKIDETVDA